MIVDLYEHFFEALKGSLALREGHKSSGWKKLDLSVLVDELTMYLKFEPVDAMIVLKFLSCLLIYFDSAACILIIFFFF